MDSYEFEIICRWVAARVRARDVTVSECDPELMEIVSKLELRSVAEAVSLTPGRIAMIAERLDRGSRRAA